MSQTDHQATFPTIAQSIQSFASRAISAQTEVSEKLIEINRHWLDHFAEEAHELQEVIRKLGGAVPVDERMSSIQSWLKGVAERGAKESKYAFDAAAELRDIELKHLKSGWQPQPPPASA
jgi:hypothetical protein